jgi:FSR family fosmidomycin resistance protein-like MFS transporter
MQWSRLTAACATPQRAPPDHAWLVDSNTLGGRERFAYRCLDVRLMAGSEVTGGGRSMASLRGVLPAAAVADKAEPSPRRVLSVACTAHALHDGYTDLIYVLLPIWQAEFSLSFAALGVLRMLWAGSLAGLQVPATAVAKRLGAPLVLASGTALCAGAYIAIGLTGAGFVVLAMALLVGGAGSATQHPLASALVARAYDGHGARSALGAYNFAGDLGKMALPAATAWLLAVMSWRHALGVIGLLGLLTASGILLLLPRNSGAAKPEVMSATSRSVTAASVGQGRRGFWLLLAIGVLDSSTRMGFLAFLPFVLWAKDASTAIIGLALTLVFAGGAIGKLACGFLGARLGVLRTVLLTELATAGGIMALAPLPLFVALACLPIIGIALNGTSSVLYGTVPELVAPEKRERAFGLFYTGTIGGGAIAPVIYGLVGDVTGPDLAIMVVAGVCIATLPLAWLLAPLLPQQSDAEY